MPICAPGEAITEAVVPFEKAAAVLSQRRLLRTLRTLAIPTVERNTRCGWLKNGTQPVTASRGLRSAAGCAS